MKLSFSQCSQPSQPQQTPSVGLSRAMSRFGLSSQLMGQSSEGMLSQEPLAECGNIMDFNSSQLSQPLCTPDFITPVEQDYSQADTGGASMVTPAVLSPVRAKRPRNCRSEVDGGDIEMCSQQQDGGGAPTSSTANTGLLLLPPTARKPMKVVRHTSPPCLRNVMSEDRCRSEDADWNHSLASLPRAQHVTSSRFRAEFKQVAVVGSGSFGRVFKVQHRLLGIEYAVKRSTHPFTTPAVRRAWLQECHAWAKVRGHPNIVRFYDAWMEPAGEGEHCFIQLEKCGEPIGMRISCGGDALTEAELLEVLKQMAMALASLHGQGIVHMDVKPDNIMLGDDGLYKLGDFGLACRLSGASANTTFSEGDCRYVAREVLNDDLRHLDKADVFALGATLYELACNSRLPDGGATYQAMREGKLKLLPGFSTKFNAMLSQLMAAKATDRPTAERILTMPLLSKRVASPPSAGHSEQSQQYGGLNLVRSR